MDDSLVQKMLKSCPFLEKYRDEDWEFGSTLVFGNVASLIRFEILTKHEMKAVFKFFNELAAEGDKDEINCLATCAIECFNDEAPSQELAKKHLKGPALEILEEMRSFWGQRDFETKPIAAWVSRQKWKWNKRQYRKWIQ